MPHRALPADASIGDRLRRIRNERGMTQESLAHAAGLSADMVKKLEQGVRTTARLTTLTKLANALDVPLSRLTDRRPRLNGAGDRLVLGLRDVLISPDLLPGVDPREDDGTPTGVDELWQLVRQSWRDYKAGDFVGVAQSLPGLIGEARVTERAVGAAATGPLVQAYDLLGNLLVQLGCEDLGAVAAGHAIAASLAGDDELQHAALHCGYAWAMINQGRSAEGERVAARAAERIEPRFSTATPEHVSVWGSLVIWAMASAVQQGHRDAAVEYISLARAGAARPQLGDRSTPAVLGLGGRFSPSHVAMQTTCAFTLLGEPDKALAPVPDVRREDLDLIDNAMHLMYVAQAQADMRQRAAAVGTLQQSQSLAPVWFRHQPMARALVVDIAERQRQLSPAMRGLIGSLEAH